MEVNEVAFDIKANEIDGWPPGFHEYVKDVARMEKFQYIERSPRHISIILPKEKLIQLQGWLEMKFGKMP